MNTIDRVLDIARSQIGTTEYPPNSNNVIYNTVYYGQPVYDGLWGSVFPWCVTGLWWCYRAAGLSELFYGGGRTSNCGTLMAYYEAHGQIVHSNYQTGDIVFFDFGGKYHCDHVGLMEKNNGDGSFTTIEFNTTANSWGSQDNGGMVCRKTRYLSEINCCARIKYGDDDVTIEGLLKTLKDATPDERLALGKALDSCVADYRRNLPLSWGEDELQEAIDMGITDGTRPLAYCTRQEASIMCAREGKKHDA